MPHTIVTAGELRNMPVEELRREIRSQRALVAKMRLEVQVKKEKDTARFRREKRQLARMLTVLRGKEGQRGQAGQGGQTGSLKRKPKTTIIRSH